MDQNLPRLYKDYGRYSNYRNFPLDLDGLKPVERRVLLSAFKIAKNGFVKSRQIDAYTIGHYHPHGECYGTVVQLVNQGFLDGQGNFGSKAGVEPTGAAAPRYTECKVSRKTLDLAFRYIDYVPWVDTELSDTEPQFLPTMFPICLLGKEYTQGIGFGFKSLIPCYTIQDLYKRLQLLLGIRKNKVIISPIADCEILSGNDVLENLLKTGKEKIEMAGHVSSIPSQNKAILRSWPAGKRFETILGKFEKELSDGLIGFSDLSTNETIIEFQVLRERNRDKIYKEFIDKLKDAVKGSVSFENIMVDINQRVVLRSIDQMLLRTFEMFSDVNVKMLTSEIERVQKQIDEYTLLEKIKPHLLVAITNGFTIKQAAEAIREMTKIPEETVIFLINKYKISKLLELKTDTTELAEIKKDFESKLTNKNQFVLEQYDAHCR